MFRRMLEATIRAGAAAVLLAAVAAQAAEPIALVTDLEGKATAGDPAAPVTILTEMAENARIEVGAGGRLVLLYLRSGDEYEFRGPAAARLASAGPEVLSGAKPEQRSSAVGRAGKGIRVRPQGLAQGALVTRSAKPGARIRLLSLNGTLTLEARPEFRWSLPQPAAETLFELSDGAGRVLHEGRVSGDSLRLPDSVALQEGVAYTWTLAARLKDGRKYFSSGDFTLAGAELRRQVEALRPAPGAPVSERVAYAVWLDQKDLRDEARRYWTAIVTERGDDPRLKSLVAE